MPDDDPEAVRIAVDAAVVKVLIDRLEAKQRQRPSEANRIALRHARVCLEWLEVRDEHDARVPAQHPNCPQDQS